MKDTLKIAFFASQLNVGGAERTITYLANHFSNKGNEVSIVLLSNEIQYDIDDSVQIIKMGIPMNAPCFGLRLVNAIKRYSYSFIYFTKNKPDVIICILPEIARYVCWFTKIKGIKLITSERNNPELDGNIKRKLKIFKKSNGIIFQTERAKKYYPKNIQNKSVVIHNAIGNKYIYECTKDQKFEKKIVAVGRLNKQKDYPTLLEAFREVLYKHPDYNMEIYGDGEEKNNLIELAKHLKIEDKVIFRGVQLDALLHIASARCYVLCSIYEGMPNALMEAMAIGLPCVSTDCPNGPRELIKDKVNGLLVPVKDPLLLANAINSIIENDKQAKMYGNNAKQILLTHSVNVISDRYLDFLKEICD